MKLHFAFLIVLGFSTLSAALTNKQPLVKIGLESPNALYSAVVIYSKPEKAVVYVDGVYVGRTPLSASIERGQHRVQIFKFGYVGSSEDFNNSAGTRLVLSHTLLGLPGEVNFAFASKTELTNAVVSNLDTSFTLGLKSLVPIAPGNWKLALKAGNYQVAFSPKGKFPVKTNFVLTPGDTLDYRFELIDMIKKWTVVSTWGKQGSGDGEFYLPQGLDAYQDKILVADSGNARLQLWNTNGQFLKNITLSGDSAFNFPVGVNFNDQIIVTDQRKNRVVYLKKDFTLDQFSSPTEPFRLPTGLDYSSASQTLALVDSDNSAIRLIKGDLTTATLDKFSLVSPLDVKWNNNNLVISDWGNKKIVLGTTTGEITKSLNLDYTPGMLSVDPKGNIYVPDTFGGRLQVFDSNLKLSNTVILSNIAYPGAVVFHDGRLYLTARDSHKIIVLEEQY